MTTIRIGHEIQDWAKLAKENRSRSKTLTALRKRLGKPRVVQTTVRLGRYR